MFFILSVTCCAFATKIVKCNQSTQQQKQVTNKLQPICMVYIRLGGLVTAVRNILPLPHVCALTCKCYCGLVTIFHKCYTL